MINSGDPKSVISVLTDFSLRFFTVECQKPEMGISLYLREMNQIMFCNWLCMQTFTVLHFLILSQMLLNRIALIQSSQFGHVRFLLFASQRSHAQKTCIQMVRHVDGNIFEVVNRINTQRFCAFSGNLKVTLQPCLSTKP